MSIEEKQSFQTYQDSNLVDYPKSEKEVSNLIKQYYKSKEYSAETFEMYSLQGTPSTILVDRNGILRDVSFGQNTNLESMVQKLLNEWLII